MNDLRVAMFVQTYYPKLGGAEKQLNSLAPFLKDAGVEICIITRRYDNSLSSYEKINGVPVFRLPVPGPKPIAAISYSLSSLPIIQNFKPHILHAHELLSPASAAIAAKKIFHIPVVAKVLRGGVLGDLAKLQKRAFGGTRIEILKRQIDKFVVISNEIDNELDEIGVPSTKRSFVPNGVDLGRFYPVNQREKKSLREKLGVPDGLTVVYSGRLDPEKRVRMLVDLWPKVLAVHPNATLLILGTGTEEGDLIKHAGNNIKFFGNIDNVAPYLQISDVFVSLSETEGLSNSLLEAMACGVAPVVTRVGGAVDLIKDGVSGVLIPVDDANLFLNKLIELLSDLQDAIFLGNVARSEIEEKYSLPAVAMKLRSLYQKLL